MPDIFIPLDTTSYSDYFDQIIRRGVINSYILNYIDNNRDRINEKYDSFREFKEYFEVTETMLNNLAERAKEEGIEPTGEEKNNYSGDKIKLQLKALIARDMWDMNEYYQIVNEEDEGYLKALEVLNNWEKYSEDYMEK